MKKGLQLSLMVICFTLVATFGKSQGLIGLGATSLTGLPDTAYFGDTLDQVKVWVVNQGTLPLSNVLVQMMAVTDLQSSPFQIGQLDLTLGLLPPGDSAEVPLDYFVVSPQNSNTGSNIMVIWPTAPGASPEDSAHGGYWVDGTTSRAEISGNSSSAAFLYPNPSTGKFKISALQSTDSEANLELFGIDGKLLDQRQFLLTEELDLSYLGDGAYLYRITTASKLLLQGRLMICRE